MRAKIPVRHVFINKKNVIDTGVVWCTINAVTQKADQIWVTKLRK